MLKRTILATVAACALAVGIQAQENATIVLRSGEKVTGQLVDMGGAGFAVRVNGQDRNIGKNDVAVIDFAGSGDVSDADWAKVNNGEGVLLRNGEAIAGQVYDIGGTTPLRVTVKTSSGERNVNSSEVSRIVLARPGGSGAAATSGKANTAGVPEGQGIAVPANQAWTATGITVRRGEVLSFNTTGEARLSNDPADIAGSAGARSQRKAPTSPIPGAFAGALIARVGSSGEVFPIGDQTTVTMPAAGQLFLGINDDHVSDNSGGFRVNVQRSGRRR
ncbi:MAG: hypothetical protein ACRD1U_14495 [Vicinamibacterales bacterium]